MILQHIGKKFLYPVEYILSLNADEVSRSMNLNYLPFEQPIVELEGKIEALRHAGVNRKIDINDEIDRIARKKEKLISSIFSKLTAHQIVQMARHPLRPYTLDYIDSIFTEFEQLHGDRHFADDGAMIGGIAKLNERSVIVIGQQKGRNTEEKLRRNFGMSKPEGFRKALRLMKLAEKFNLPVFTMIDTPGAYPGIGAEERNQSEAIARNLFEMSQLKTPIICTVIGEGCSGGALAIGLGDVTLMLQYSYYSVISPEGCASILWKSAEKAKDAAEALNLTAPRLLSLGLIDEVIEEPLGGAHRDAALIAKNLKNVWVTHLKQLESMPINEVVQKRYDRWLRYGTSNSK
jgi:acetyl-CoA carboxylase carboxyl transferase subunit alpha